MSTISLGDQAFCKTLHADTIKYKNLDPPAGGSGLDNPMTGPLKCAGFDIGAVGAQAAGGVFCDTLHYTTLDPVINAGLTNPLQKDVTCTGFSILDATKLSCAGASITNTIACGTVNSIYSDLEQLDIVAAGLGSGNLTVGGQVKGKKVTASAVGGVDVQASGDLTVTGGRTTLNGGLDVPSGPKQNHVRNIMHFTNQVMETGSGFGFATTPIIIGPVGLPSYKVFALPVGSYVLDLVSLGVVNEVLFDVHTTYGKVLDTYVIETASYCIDDAGVGVYPSYKTKTIEAAKVSGSGTGNFSCRFTFDDVNPGFAQVFRTRVKISFPS